MYIKTKLDFYPSTIRHVRFYGVMVSTLDFESSDPSSNLGRTYSFFCCLFKSKKLKCTFVFVLFLLVFCIVLPVRLYIDHLPIIQNKTKFDFHPTTMRRDVLWCNG